MSSEAVKIIVEAEDKATRDIKRIEQEAVKSFEQFERIKNQQIEMLKLERIALEQGAEAAESMRLQMQGLDRDTADMIAREKQLIESLKAQKREQDALARSQAAAASRGPAPGRGLANTKASAEFFGTVAGFAGGGVLSDVSGQIATMTDRTSQFGEVAEKGKLGALAFKGGLVAAAGAIGFQLGKALGDVIFQTERWNKELDRSVDQIGELQGKAQELTDNFLTREFEAIKLIDDPEEQKQRLAELDAIIQKNIDGQVASIRKNQKEIETAEQSWVSNGTMWWTALQESNIKGWQLQNEHSKELLETYKNLKTEAAAFSSGDERTKETKELADAEAERSKSFVSGLEEELKMLQATKEEQREMIAMKNAVGQEDQLRAMYLQAEIDRVQALKDQEADLEKQREESFKKALEKQAKLNELKQKETDNIDQQIRKLMQGEQASQAFELMKQGMDEATAKGVASIQSMLDEYNKLQGMSTSETSLSARGGRLMTGSGEVNSQLKEIQASRKIQEKMAELLERSSAALEALRDKEPIEVTKRAA